MESFYYPTPSWLEDPSRLAPLLQASVKAPALSVKQVQKSELRVDARTSFGALLKSWYSRSATRRLLLAVERLEAFMRMDEEHHFLSGVLLVPSRQVILAGGDALTQQALLESKEAVFFLTLEELKAALQAPGSAISFVPLARRRESEWRRSFKSNPPFELPEPPRTAREPCTVGAVYWQGSPMSPGIVTGRVLIAEHIDQISGIEPGTILVTTSPNPALTPLYPLLGGLIAATGSALSHGFVSAREYALPAVSGIARATDTIPNGAWVRLDGNTGLVEVIQP
jgi:phosphohistidine swiveling domain-containing protein